MTRYAPEVPHIDVVQCPEWSSALASQWISVEPRMRAGSSITSQALFLDAGAPEAPPRPVLPRRPDHECSSSHRGDHLISVVRSPGTPNSEVVVSALADPGSTTVRWREAG